MHPAANECTTQVQVFSNEEFGAVRALQISGEPWFSAVDVCRVLEIGNPSQAMTRLDGDEVTLISNEGSRESNYVSEPGLYSLILGSRKPEARAFKRWVTHEVIPAIRRRGLYATPAAAEAMLADPDAMIAALQALKAERAKAAELEASNAEMAPKALFADAVAASDTSILVGEMAKLLKQNGVDTGQKRFFEWLRANGFLMKGGTSKNMPTQRSMELGLFEIKERTVSNPDGTVRITKTPKVTGKGQVYFTNLLVAEAN